MENSQEKNDVKRIRLDEGITRTSASGDEASSSSTESLARTEDTEKETVVKKLVGTWCLKTFMNKSVQGDARNPFGEKPRGQLYYGNQGHVGVHIMRSHRDRIMPKTHYEASGTEAQRIVNDFFAYSGTYSVDPKQEVVHHNLETHISPNQVGEVFSRRYKFSQDEGGNPELSLTMVSDPSKELVWTRKAAHKP